MKYGIALGSWSVTDRGTAISGCNPITKLASTSKSSAWKSSLAALSIGSSKDGLTRQITGVSAGSEDTDAANVAQLKSVMNMPVHFYQGGKKDTSGLYTSGNPVATHDISSLKFDFGDGLKAEEVN